MKVFRKKILSFWNLNLIGWSILYFGMLISTLSGLLIYKGKTLNDIDLVGYSLTYVLGILLTIVMRKIYSNILNRKISFRRLGVIVILSTLLFGHIWFASDIVFSSFLHGYEWMIKKFSFYSWKTEIVFYSMVVLSWSTMYFGIKFWIEWENEKKKTEEANALAQSAQLQMLRYQLNPHFLFNSLNSIRALIDEDKSNAKNMITELSEFLRYSLISKNFKDVPLMDEIEAIEHYFAIEKKRYEEKLDVTINVEPLAEDYPVLSFLIHPLTENAVKYGMQTSNLPLKISINAKVIENRLILEVCNSGKWIEPKDHDESMSTGTGLDNVRQRLKNAFPGSHSFKINKNDDNVCIIIEIEKKLNSND